MTLKNVIKKKEWNETAIIERAEWLAEVAVKIWPSYLPGQEDEVVDFDIEDTETAHGSEEEQTVVPKKKKRNMKHEITAMTDENTETVFADIP